MQSTLRPTRFTRPLAPSSARLHSPKVRASQLTCCQRAFWRGGLRESITTDQPWLVRWVASEKPKNPLPPAITTRPRTVCSDIKIPAVHVTLRTSLRQPQLQFLFWIHTIWKTLNDVPSADLLDMISFAKERHAAGARASPKALNRHSTIYNASSLGLIFSTTPTSVWSRICRSQYPATSAGLCRCDGAC